MRDILLTLCGLTPQVITETLWALAHQQPPVVPEEIWIFTTRSGREICRRTLLGPTGKIRQFYREFHPGQALPQLTLRQIVTLTNAQGVSLDDVRTAEENHAIGDQLANCIRRLTTPTDTRIHCSIAGGRKTMGILLAAALQVYGREQDALYHVLVSPEFENHPGFFYKPRRSLILKQADGSRLSTKDAVIQLAEIPYVRLRALLPEDVLAQGLSLGELVSHAQQELHALSFPEPVQINFSRKILKIGEKTIALTPAEFDWYSVLAKVKTDQCAEPTRPFCAGCTACYVVLSNETWERESTRLAEEGSLKLMGAEDPGPDALPRFRALVSKINRALKETLASPRIADQYAIRATGGRYAKAYGLAAEKKAIQFR